MTLAELRALAPRFGPVALVQFDFTPTPGTAISRANAIAPVRLLQSGRRGSCRAGDHSIQIGMRGSLFQITDITQSLALGYDVLTCDAVFEMGTKAVADRIAMRTAGRPCSLPSTWISSTRKCAGRATPELGGPTARETLLLLRHLHGIRLVGCDVVEMNRHDDDPGQTTALLAATVMAELLALSVSGKQ